MGAGLRDMCVLQIPLRYTHTSRIYYPVYVSERLAILATFFIMSIAALFPLMTLHHFSGNTYRMSIVEIAWGIGMLMGGAILGLPRPGVNCIVYE